jgi:hypothetical protein
MAALEFSNSIRSLFEDNNDPATKRDIANLYATAVLLFDAVSAASASLSYDPNTEDGIKASKHYGRAMERVLTSIKSGTQELMVGKSNG